LIFGFPFRVVFVVATRSRKFGAKFPKFFKTTEFLRRITRMVTNLMAAHSISFAASYGFVSGADGIGDTRGKSCDGKRRASREAIEFQIRVMAPTVLILEEKLAKGVWKMKGWTAREH